MRHPTRKEEIPHVVTDDCVGCCSNSKSFSFFQHFSSDSTYEISLVVLASEIAD